MYAWCKADKNRSIKYLLVLIVFIMGLFLLVIDYSISVRELENGLKRNAYGKGEKKQVLEIKTDESERQDLEIQISEQKYQDDEIQELFQSCIELIEREMLGENESPDYVVSDLNLMTSLHGKPVEINWELDSYDVMNIYGEIHEEYTVQEGTLVKLEAVLTYTQDREKQMVFESAVVVYPHPMTETEQFAEDLKDKIQEKDAETQTKETLVLPEKLDGKKIMYFEKMDSRGLVLMIMAVLAAFLFYAQEIQNQGKALQEKRRQMIIDYPEILNKLTLFLGAGMTVKRAFLKIVKDYEVEKERWGPRYAYEEMKVTCREMESKISETECYERFGKRCGIQEYIRLGGLLSQNMRKGTKGLNHMLRIEAMQAFENRKAQAKKAGEEAGTKLLIPMFLMLAVVLVMVIVPAFFSMQV